jgi:DNA-binding transcriptional MerR regulator
MSYSVGDVARSAGVTVRTLHHYDEIGLLPPSGRSTAGYRQYDDRDLERLQEVLFYRELGFGLDEIMALVSVPIFNRAQILRQQRILIERRIDRLQSMATAVDRAMRALEEGSTMNNEELFGTLNKEDQIEIFGDFDPKRYEAEVRERWSETEAYAESSKRTARYTKDDWKRMGEEAGVINQSLADLFAAGTSPEAETSMEAAEQHRLHIDRWFYPCSHELHAGLGEMYVADPRFTKFWDEIRPGLAAFVRDAFLANGLRAAG